MTKHGVAASAVAVASAEAADAVARVPSGPSPGHSVPAAVAMASALAVLAGRAG
jgi:hypothetical protein